MSSHVGLVKNAVSKGRMTVSQTRSGRRPMRVDTLLKKEKEGTLYKYTKMAEALRRRGVGLGLLKQALGVPMTPMTSMTPSATQQMKAPQSTASGPKMPGVGVAPPSVPGLSNSGAQPAAMPKMGQVRLPESLDEAGEQAQKLVALRKKVLPETVSYIRDALREGLTEKTAEPPPPEGISMEQWDHLLNKGTHDESARAPTNSKKKPGDVPTLEDDYLGSNREELPVLAIAKFGAAADEMRKLCAMTTEQARQSLSRLETLKKQPTGELARGAAVGAIAAPLLGVVTRRVRGGEPVAAGLRALMAKGGRNLAADAITGATYGGAVPAVRNLLERKVETERLQDYVAGGKRRGLRRTVARHVGV